MLIPQYSLRWLLGATTLAAVVCAIVALGLRGQRWALAVSFGLASFVVLMLICALLFAAVWILSLVFSRSGHAGRSPFKKES